MVFVAVITNGVGEQQSFIRRTSGKIRVPQKKVDGGQLEIDNKAIWLFFNQGKKLRKSNQELSKIVVLDLFNVYELTESSKPK